VSDVRRGSEDRARGAAVVMRRLGVGAILLLCAWWLAGCGGTLHWAKSGATTQDFQRDSYDCARGSQQNVFRFGGPIWMQPTDKDRVNRELYRSCMQAQGYERAEGGTWEGHRD